MRYKTVGAFIEAARRLDDVTFTDDFSDEEITLARVAEKEARKNFMNELLLDIAEQLADGCPAGTTITLQITLQ